VIAPALLRDRSRYERLMLGRCDNGEGDTLTHVVSLRDPDRAIELEVDAYPSPTYEIAGARLRLLDGRVDAALVAAAPALAGVGMVAGFTRRVAARLGDGEGAAFVIDAAIEVARLSRQVARLPRARAERATIDAWEAWQLDRAGFTDLPDSCFTYSAAGEALFGTRTVSTMAYPDLYSPAPGQQRVFERRKLARLERDGDRLTLTSSMHDNVHGFDVTLQIDAPSERITRAGSLVTRLPYAGICSEPQGKIGALVGEIADPGLSRRIQRVLGGVTGCAQLYDLTADVLKLLRA
jgi:Protein of unknown function (DUF2889)